MRRRGKTANQLKVRHSGEFRSAAGSDSATPLFSERALTSTTLPKDPVALIFAITLQKLHLTQKMGAKRLLPPSKTLLPERQKRLTEIVDGAIGRKKRLEMLLECVEGRKTRVEMLLEGVKRGPERVELLQMPVEMLLHFVELPQKALERRLERVERAPKLSSSRFKRVKMRA